MPAATPQAGPAALQPRPATTTQAPRPGLVLAVIATAQLMVALDVTVVTGFLKTEGLT